MCLTNVVASNSTPIRNHALRFPETIISRHSPSPTHTALVETINAESPRCANRLLRLRRRNGKYKFGQERDEERRGELHIVSFGGSNSRA
jgi:hypothetical protein